MRDLIRDLSLPSAQMKMKQQIVDRWGRVQEGGIDGEWREGENELM